MIIKPNDRQQATLDRWMEDAKAQGFDDSLATWLLGHVQHSSRHPEDGHDFHVAAVSSDYALSGFVNIYGNGSCYLTEADWNNLDVDADD